MMKRDIKKMLTIGKEERPAQRSVQSRVQIDNGNWSAPIRAYAHESRSGGRREKDHCTRAPGPPATTRGGANYLRRAAFQVDRFELTVGKESEGTAVGRPERKSSIFATRQGASFHRVRETDPECSLAVRAGGRKRDVRSIGRKHGRTCRIASQVECGLFWRIDDSADGTTRLSRMVEEHSSSCSQNDRGQKNCGPTKTLTAARRGDPRRYRGPRRLISCNPIQLKLNVVRRQVTLFGIFLQASRDDVLENRRSLRLELGHRLGIALQDRGCQ